MTNVKTSGNGQFGRTEASPTPGRGFHRSALLKREMPGLDILRGVAILAVVFYHGLRWTLPGGESVSQAARRLGEVFAGGWMGVNLFFVLSGFLISGILLDTRQRESYWRSFYIRRALRIVPLYLFTLLLLAICVGMTWTYFLVYLLYLVNFGSAFGLHVFGPFWSLSVEEQFYLVWPWLVRKLSLRSLAALCIASIIVSPILRGISSSGILRLGDSTAATWLITDNLAFGALVAIFLRTPLATSRRVTQLIVATGLGGVGLLLVGWKLHLLTRAPGAAVGFQLEPFLLLFTCALLLSLRLGDNPRIFRLTAILRFFGYISYGMYLFHMFIFYAYDMILSHLHKPADILTADALVLRFAISFIGLTLVCWLSRRYFEEYFLRQKDRLARFTN